MIYDILEQRQPINFFEFIINPESFGQTVENLFYLSFLIRDCKVCIDDESGQPILSKYNNIKKEVCLLIQYLIQLFIFFF
jgi:hypothetical protein